MLWFAVLCASLTTCASAQIASPPPPPRWSEAATIGVWIDPKNAPTGADGLILRAMHAWTDAARPHFRLERTATADLAGIRVRFVGGDSVYGETRPRIDRASGAIVSADVYINREIAVAGDALGEKIVLYLTALHELGHALGLPHTDVFDAIMYGFRRPDDGERYFEAYRRRLRSAEDVGSARASGVAPADIAALRALYGR